MVFEDGVIGEFQHYAAKFGPKVIGELKRLKASQWLRCSCLMDEGLRPIK